MNTNDKYFNINRVTWNKKVQEHAKGTFYNLEAFKNGRSSLNAYELDALGEVKGKSLLHLQCHFGQDTLSLSRMGARCTGVDISDVGIEMASQLNDDLELDAQFVCCNVLDTKAYIKEVFDIVYTSYGVIGWLPDLKPWGAIIADKLKKGGTFFMAEFHPITWMFDYLNDEPKIAYGYMQDEVIYEEYKGTYGNEQSQMLSKEYAWNHGLGEVITALTEAGLHIEYVNEFYESPYDILPNMVRTKTKMYALEDRLYPLIFTVKATKL
ncbi:class I SAM-dependent methyltransferase [Aestuariivivens sediminicola]|uniref:class I SAM-dependent methyltransferase n=1 Tax=Aestuariivivens sediminicola TaxID=2913560 RepID=UPI001F560765|nr:class I SAM-dependent methyltransferase [Aestuariivivens sediminicola]